MKIFQNLFFTKYQGCSRNFIITCKPTSEVSSVIFSHFSEYGLMETFLLSGKPIYACFVISRSITLNMTQNL